LVEANEAVIAKNVTENLFDRHIAPVFLGKPSPIATREHAEAR
jgi:hypothetical protein